MNTISTPDQLISVPICSRCGREGWQAVFTCPERAAGNCLFVKQQRQPLLTPFRAGIMVVFLIALGIVALAFFQPRYATAAVLFEIAALAGIAVSLLATRARTVTLCEPTSGAQLRRTTLGNIELRCAHIAPPELVALDLALPQEVVHPPSVIMLPGGSAPATINLAVNMASAALIGLLASRQLQACRTPISESILGRRPTRRYEYLFAGGSGSTAPAKGWLEENFRMALGGSRLFTENVWWSAPGEGIRHDKGGSAESAVYHIYVADESSPASWLVEQVIKNAVELGLGCFDRALLVKHFEWNKSVKAQIEQERAALTALVRQLREMQPDLVSTVESQIRAGIRARQEKNSGSGC